MKKPEDLKKLIKNSNDSVESKDPESSLPKDGDVQDLVTKT
jgi:hypothetical protein